MPKDPPNWRTPFGLNPSPTAPSTDGHYRSLGHRGGGYECNLHSFGTGHSDGCCFSGGCPTPEVAKDRAPRQGTSDKVIPDEEADVAILEEPEHLNWFPPGRGVARGAEPRNYIHCFPTASSHEDKLSGFFCPGRKLRHRHLAVSRGVSARTVCKLPEAR